MLDEFKEEELSSFSAAVDKVTARANALINVGVPVGIGIMLAIFVLAIFTSRHIIARVNSIVASLRNIAKDDGDMSVRVAVQGRDEMAELAFWFNRIIEKLERVTRESTLEIRRLAYTDTLTNLPNRRLFNQYLAGEVHRCRRDQTALAVMFLDLDNFKSGERSVGARCRRCARQRSFQAVNPHGARLRYGCLRYRLCGE